MLLIKKLGTSRKDSRLNLSKYEENFLFFNYFHHTHKKQLSRLGGTGEIARKADFAAAVTAKLLSVAHYEKLVILALRCCRDILLSRGFEETTRPDLEKAARDEATTKKERIIFVAGCQTEDLLEARVESALQLIRTIKNPVHIAFVGGAPSGKKPRIPHEHARMKEMFFNMLDGTYGKKNFSDVKEYVVKSNIFEERYSKTTQENIKLFFGHDFFEGSSRRSLYLVSSTFHLLRLARECMQFLDSKEGKRFNVEELVLSGADHVNKPSKHVFEPIYLKLMFFDIYFHLFSEMHMRASYK